MIQMKRRVIKVKLDILCNDGSPLGVVPTTIWGDKFRIGVGGAELALLTMCEAWAGDGHEVTLYNNPHTIDVTSNFEQTGISEFDVNANRDILIIFRSPNPKAVPAKGKKIWWSCDQYTIGNFQQFGTAVNKIVCISPFHQKHFKDYYNLGDTVSIDLPVRLQDYVNDETKIKNRFIFTSVPDRGLQHLWRIWNIISREIKDASLVVTADYRLWGTVAGNENHRVKWSVFDNVQFLGAVPREQLVKEEMKAEYFIYPCEYDELFCISCAEAQAVGAYPFTTNTGALRTTNMGTIIDVNPKDSRNDKLFADTVIEMVNDENIKRIRLENQKKALERFNINTILEQWDKVFE